MLQWLVSRMSTIGSSCDHPVPKRTCSSIPNLFVVCYPWCIAAVDTTHHRPPSSTQQESNPPETLIAKARVRCKKYNWNEDLCDTQRQATVRSTQPREDSRFDDTDKWKKERFVSLVRYRMWRRDQNIANLYLFLWYKCIYGWRCIYCIIMSHTLRLLRKSAILSVINRVRQLGTGDTIGNVVPWMSHLLLSFTLSLNLKYVLLGSCLFFLIHRNNSQRFKNCRSKCGIHGVHGI